MHARPTRTCKTWSCIVAFALILKFKQADVFTRSSTWALELWHMTDCQRFSLWRQTVRLLLTTALCYHDLTDLVFNSCHTPSNIKNLCIRADRSACLFASPRGDRLWMHIWTGAFSWRKTEPLWYSENISSRGGGGKISPLHPQKRSLTVLFD